MAKCKYCNETDLKWYQDSVTKRFSLIYPDGTIHRCQTQVQIPQQQEQQIYRSPNSGDAQAAQQAQAAKQISTNEIDRRLTDISANNLSLKEQISKLTELYNDIMQYLVETTRAAKESAEAAKKSGAVLDEINQLLSVYVTAWDLKKQEKDSEEQKLAEQEYAYDQDKEDGLV